MARWDNRSIVTFAPMAILHRSPPQCVIITPGYENVCTHIQKWSNTCSRNSHQTEPLPKLTPQYFWFMQPSNKTSQLYPDDTVGKSFTGAYVCCKEILTEVFMEKVDSFECYNWQNYWALNPQVDLTDMAFQRELSLTIPKGAGSTPQNIETDYNFTKKYNKNTGTATKLKIMQVWRKI